MASQSSEKQNLQYFQPDGLTGTTLNTQLQIYQDLDLT